jgi:hypothetical protein
MKAVDSTLPLKSAKCCYNSDMTFIFKRAVVVALLGIPLPTLAQTAPPSPQTDPPPPLQAVPEPPPLPDRLESGQVMEPDVRIIRRDKSTVTEYRVNGRLRAIKVTPDGDFPPYYLYDTHGDGRLDQRRSRYEPDLLIPSWVIFSW